MIEATCIQKFRTVRNRIYCYRLQDNSGSFIDVKPDELKNAIRNKQIYVTNLTLTSDNRLIDSSQQAETNKFDIMLNKARLLGKLETIQTSCGNPCYMISTNKDSYIIYIPDNVAQFREQDYYTLGVQSIPVKKLKELKGRIKVIGGNGVNNAYRMFNEYEAQSLDLSSFSTSNITDMGAMFDHCRVKSLDLSTFNTNKVVDMHFMFASCKAQSINLSSFNTSKVVDMSFMFAGCKAQRLDLSSFDTRNVTNMYYMFNECEAQYIDLTSFDTSGVEDLDAMFDGCTAKSIKTKDKRLLEAFENRWTH